MQHGQPCFLGRLSITITKHNNSRGTAACGITVLSGGNGAIRYKPQDNLLDQSEYVGFVNRLSSNEFAGSTFGELPGVIQTNFFDYDVNNYVDIYGARLGEDPTTEQDLFLVDFCADTNETIAIASGVTPEPASPTVSPTPPISTPPPTQSSPTVSPTTIASSASPTGRPTAIATPAPTTRRPTFSATPAPAITSIPTSSMPATAKPTLAPGPQTTARPTGTRLQCFAAMTVADEDANSFMNQDEYVLFVSELADGEYGGSAFDDLPSALQDNFQQLATPYAIDIRGSKSGSTPTQDQLDFLIQVCDNTYVALQTAAIPVSSPTQGPTISRIPTLTQPSSSAPIPSTSFPIPTSSPTATTTTIIPTPMPSFSASQSPTPPPVSVEGLVLSSEFIISNTEGLLAADFISSNAERRNLDESYNTMTNETVVRIYGGDGGAVDFVFNSGRTETFTDIDCPSSESDAAAVCQIVTATFKVTAPTDESDNVSSTLTDEVDFDIADGNLQAILVQEGSGLLVVSNLSPAPNSPSSPTISPSPSPPSVSNFTGILSIPSAFTISNSVGVTATGLGEGSPFREELLTSFNAMTANVVKSMSQNATTTRRLDSGPQFVENSGAFNNIIDVQCPDSVSPGSFCQAVYAAYEINVDNVNSGAVIEDFGLTTQEAISAGDLEAELTAVNPETPFAVLEKQYQPWHQTKHLNPLQLQ
ncbi:hypothetical protein MHU86_8091 [Fragilaria crotonensis]|nr:hypothetical protein MHU86_8091 [Fragilaria crotonensis]